MLIIPLVIFVLLFFVAVGWGYQVNKERVDLKDNVDQKISAAVDKAKEEEAAANEKEFLEREKNPYRQYRGPSTFGSVSITYPKTWSAAVTETTSGTTPVNGYMHPSFVPGAKSGTAFALRVEVIEQTYDRVLQTYESNAKMGRVRVSPYKAAKVPQVLGSRVNGEIIKGYSGSAVLLPLRDKTIRISTMSQQFVKDFDNIVMKNFVFTP